MTSDGIGIYIPSISYSGVADVGIILDGDGHTITGTGTSGIDHDGVRISGQSWHVTIKDLTIKNFKNGINSYYTNGLTVSGVTIDSASSYAMYIFGNQNIVTPTDITGNTVKNSNSGINLFDIKSDVGSCTSGTIDVFVQ